MTDSSQLSRSEIVIRTDDWAGGQETFVQFRLLYSGRLLGASRNDPRPRLKHEIRKELSLQMERLWATNINLRRYSRNLGPRWINMHQEIEVNLPPGQEELFPIMCGFGIDYLANAWKRADQKFVPIVTQQMGLRCKLDILFLRPEEPGLIVKGGDLDNRIKTLFDALRLPTDASEMGGYPPEDKPIYCLLEDDRLVSEVRIVADHLLMLPKESTIDANDVFLVIDVSLEAPPNSEYTWVFG